MALNFSHLPIYPGHLSEDNLVSPVKIDRGGSPEPGKDILDLLPSDPFGMDISSTFTAITGWLEDLEVDYSKCGRNHFGSNDTDFELFAGLNFIWNKAMGFQAFPGNLGDTFTFLDGLGSGCFEKELGAVSCHGLPGYMEDILGLDEESSANSYQPPKEFQVSAGSCADGDAGTPHPALPFALDYLGVQDLLSVERVCKFLHCTVRSDSLLWRRIHIDQPLNEKITDDILLHLTSRAQSNLQCLSLVECPRITDDGLRRVLECNPRITKLSVPGCTRLSVEGVVNSMKAIKCLGIPGIQKLRIGGLYGVTQSHFEELKFLLGMDSQNQNNATKPHFYHRGQLYLSCDDDRAIDIEMCPRCQNLRLVYDCPAEGCKGKDHVTQVCRACTLCIPRCVQCGWCINDGEYEETFCLELLCSGCWKQLMYSDARKD